MPAVRSHRSRGGDRRHDVGPLSCCASGSQRRRRRGRPVASAVTFVGAQVITGSIDLFTGGLPPIGSRCGSCDHHDRSPSRSPPVPSGRRQHFQLRSPVRDRAAQAPRAVRRGGHSGRHLSPPPWRPTCPVRSQSAVSSGPLGSLLWLRGPSIAGLLQEVYIRRRRDHMREPGTPDGTRSGNRDRCTRSEGRAEQSSAKSASLQGAEPDA